MTTKINNYINYKNYIRFLNIIMEGDIKLKSISHKIKTIDQQKENNKTASNSYKLKDYKYIFEAEPTTKPFSNLELKYDVKNEKWLPPIYNFSENLKKHIELVKVSEKINKISEPIETKNRIILTEPPNNDYIESGKLNNKINKSVYDNILNKLSNISKAPKEPKEKVKRKKKISQKIKDEPNEIIISSDSIEVERKNSYLLNYMNNSNIYFDKNKQEKIENEAKLSRREKSIKFKHQYNIDEVMCQKSEFRSPISKRKILFVDNLSPKSNIKKEKELRKKSVSYKNRSSKDNISGNKDKKINKKDSQYNPNNQKSKKSVTSTSKLINQKASKSKGNLQDKSNIEFTGENVVLTQEKENLKDIGNIEKTKKDKPICCCFPIRWEIFIIEYTLIIH